MFLSDNLKMNEKGHLTMGGADVVALAEKYGTPLYLMDENYIRETCRRYRNEMHRHFGEDCVVAFAGKAFCISYMYKILQGEGLFADVVSGGELYTALHAGYPADRLIFHGNNKTREEIEYALTEGVFRFVVDNGEELDLLDETARSQGKIAKIQFRIKPGIDAHTHDYVLTGKIDSKFGVALETGEALKLVREALKHDNIELCGVHCHIGSQIFDAEPYTEAVNKLTGFIRQVHDQLGYELSDLNLGGGFGIKYLPQDDPRTPEENVRSIAAAVQAAKEKYRIKRLRVMIEPGRSIIGPAGMTVYTVGSVKTIPGVRTYVAVDGGMTDNLRYALYGSEYEILNAAHPGEKKDMIVTLAGRNCESGDLIGENMPVQKVGPGDKIAVLATGAYNYSMASNYNRVPRPPVVMVCDGQDKLAVRRESYEDIVRNDLL